ncbi:MAG: BatA domain-containing protein [Planctomycetota bacterium]|nr:BatA domain-containing protein [Planctomycetota bacterium]
MSGFELARPEALWGLLLGLPVLLFHLYARRRQRIVVPYAGLLREALGPARPTSRFKHLREAASLLMRLTALACLVLAIGGLRPATAKTPPVDLMLVVDGDVTTAAVEARLAPRLALGLELAAAHARAHDGGRVGAVLAGDPPTLLAPLDADREAVARRLDRAASQAAGRPLQTGEAPLPAPAAVDTDLDAAVRAAAAAATERGRGRVVVISARPVAELDAADVELVLAGVGTARDDQRIADLVVAPGAGLAYDVGVELTSDAKQTATRRVVATFVDDGTSVFDESVEIDAEQGATVRFAATPPGRAGAMLEVRFEQPDAFARNDVVRAWLAPRRKPSVLLVKSGQPRAFTALVLDQLADDIDVEQSGFVDAADFAEAEMRDVVVVDGVALPEGGLRPGAYVFLAPLQGALPFEVGAPIQKPLVWRTTAHHPLVRWLDFSAADIQVGVSLTGEGLVPLGFADDAVVVAEGEQGGVRYVALGLDPRASYLSVQTALPLFLRRAVLRLAQAPVTPLEPFYRVGDALRPRLPLPGGPAAEVRWAPFGAGREADVERAEARVDPRGTAWRVPAGAHGEARITPSGAGGWTGRTAFLDFAPERTIAPVRAPAEAPPARPKETPERDLWQWWLVVIALVLLALDLLLLPRSRRARS